MSFRRAQLLAFLLAPFAAAALTACLDAGAAAGTPIGGSGSFTERVDGISGQVLTDAATVTANVESAVTTFGDAAVAPGDSAALITLHRDAEDLSSEAQTAVYRLSVLSPPDECQEFHRRHSEAVELFGRMASEYARATDVAGPDTEDRIDMQYIERGDDYRANAQVAMTEAEGLRGQCGG